MAVKLRLTRMGAKKAPFYRIVAIDERKARDGQYLENVGTYNPATEELNIKSDRALYWLGVGAQPTETVRTLLKRQEIIK
ncbi:MAG TPA: 30S ribosomal protein S16 [Candidatus Ornithoclostridium faecavium]|nr:30S ribosomal protein S16 [Candidatus Ornithoclostridium faecavium]